MAANHPNQRGLSRIIFQAVSEIMPEMARGSQFIDFRLLQNLENELRQKLVMRADGSPRLVIDLVLSRSMAELRHNLGQNCLLPPDGLRTPLNSVASL